MDSPPSAPEPSRSPIPEPRSLFSRLLPLAFLLWAALVGMWYYGSARHDAAMAAFVAYCTPVQAASGAVFFLPVRLLIAAGVVLAGGVVLCFAARRRRVSRRAGWGALAVLAAAALAGAFTPGLGSRVLVAALVLLTLAAAVGLGALVLRLLGVRTRSAAEELGWSGALGLGTLSLGFVLIGLVGLFKPLALAAAALAALIVGWRELWRLVPRLAEAARRAQRCAGVLGNALVLFLIALLAWRAAYCFAPPLLGEADYDALEYHLAAPLEWLAAGRVSFLAHNVYANMPAGAEMLYALGLGCLPDFFSGYCFAKLLGLGASVLSAFAVYAAARRMGGRRAALAGAAIFFSGLWLADLASAPFVEHFLILYVTVAWSAFAAFAAHRPPPTAYRLLAVAGLAAGFAAATKYTAAVLVAAPLGAAVLVAGLLRAFPRPEPRTPDPEPKPRVVGTLAAAALVGALALAVASPWYVRNWLADGNPFYPLAASVFPSRHWDADKQARWARAHAPQEHPAAAAWNALAGRLESDGRAPDPRSSALAWRNLFTGPLLAVFAPLVPLALWRRRRRAAAFALWLAALAAVYVAGWAGLTHQIDRFLWPAFGGLAALAATGSAALIGRAGRGFVPGVVLAGALFVAPAEVLWTQAVHKLPGARVLAGRADPHRFLNSLEAGEGLAWRSIAAVNSLPPGSKVLLVGEARPALFRVPTVSATVFDTHPLERALAESTTPRELARRLRALGVTHVYCNWSELGRLRTTYGVPLSPEERRRREAEGVVLLPDGRLPGCFALTKAKEQLLDAFERDQLRFGKKPWGPPMTSPLTGRTAWPLELWRLLPETGENP